MEKSKFTEKKVRGAVSTETVFQYLSAEWGEWLGIYEEADGLKCYVGQDIGNEIAEYERPVAVIKCPGIGNLDTSDFWSGFAIPQDNGTYVTDDGKILDLVELLKATCEDGDVSGYINSIVEGLLRNIEENELQLSV